jgi:hypothetical protein
MQVLALGPHRVVVVTFLSLMCLLIARALRRLGIQDNDRIKRDPVELARTAARRTEHAARDESKRQAHAEEQPVFRAAPDAQLHYQAIAEDCKQAARSRSVMSKPKPKQPPVIFVGGADDANAVLHAAPNVPIGSTVDSVQVSGASLPNSNTVILRRPQRSDQRSGSGSRILPQLRAILNRSIPLHRDHTIVRIIGSLAPSTHSQVDRDFVICLDDRPKGPLTRGHLVPWCEHTVLPKAESPSPP